MELPSSELPHLSTQQELTRRPELQRWFSCCEDSITIYGGRPAGTRQLWRPDFKRHGRPASWLSGNVLPVSAAEHFRAE